MVGDKGKLFSPDDYGSQFYVMLKDEQEYKSGRDHEACKPVPQSIERSLVMPTITAEWEKEVRDQLEAAKTRGYMWAHTGNVVQCTPDIVVPRYRDYIRRGVSFFIVQLPDGRNLKQIEFVAKQVIAELV